MIRTRSLAVSAALIAALGSVVACTSTAGSGGKSSAPTTTALAPSASTPVTTTTTTVAASSASSRSATSGTSRCAESQLRASVEADNIPGVNRHVIRLLFKNESGTPCTLTGYPGVATVDVKGHQQQQATRVTGGVVGGTIEKSATLTL